MVKHILKIFHQLRKFFYNMFDHFGKLYIEILKFFLKRQIWNIWNNFPLRENRKISGNYVFFRDIFWEMFFLFIIFHLLLVLLTYLFEYRSHFIIVEII